MDITVTFRHMEPTESLKTYAEEKEAAVKSSSNETPNLFTFPIVLPFSKR